MHGASKDLDFIPQQNEKYLQVIFLGYLFCAKNESESFTWINAFNPHSYNPVRLASQPDEAKFRGSCRLLLCTDLGEGVVTRCLVRWGGLDVRGLPVREGLQTFRTEYP